MRSRQRQDGGGAWQSRRGTVRFAACRYKRMIPSSKKTHAPGTTAWARAHERMRRTQYVKPEPCAFSVLRQLPHRSPPRARYHEGALGAEIEAGRCPTTPACTAVAQAQPQQAQLQQRTAPAGESGQDNYKLHLLLISLWIQ
jgi:hypothetical protein